MVNRGSQLSLISKVSVDLALSAVSTARMTVDCKKLPDNKVFCYLNRVCLSNFVTCKFYYVLLALDFYYRGQGL